jgi:hypothetical protein
LESGVWSLETVSQTRIKVISVIPRAF